MGRPAHLRELSDVDITYLTCRARLIALAPRHDRVAGLHLGAITRSADFDDSLPGDFWTGTT